MNGSEEGAGEMGEHPFILKHTKDWSPERRGRFKAMLEDRAAEPAASGEPPKPAYAYPVHREDMDRLLPAGLRTYLNLAAEIGLTQDEKMALLGLPTSDEMPQPEQLGEEQFYRLSYFIGIYADVGALLGKEDTFRWLTAPYFSDELKGRSPVTYLIEEGLPGFDYLRRKTTYKVNDGW